jgi:2-polyprenyl-3-methyl-5-hydroxy-6-metoxy-1,4-benzoquinol methylase
MSETDKIIARYELRKSKKYNYNDSYSQFVIREREKIYSLILNKNFPKLNTLKVIEIGAGYGGNIRFFLNAQIQPANLHANELIWERINALKNSYPNIHIHPGNALDLNFTEEFDIVFQSTVFTSILDNDFRKKLAEKMWEMLKPGGIVLWYDFIYNNPNNPHVKKVSKAEVTSLFSKAKSISFYPVTLAPPIGRKIGALYNLVNTLFPFLRTHIIAEIHK